MPDRDAPTTPTKTDRPRPEVKLPVFNGPLDLLLYLIDRDEIDVLEIPIADILEQYVSHLKLIKDVDVNVAGEFLVMAARLMELKSRLLLPVPEDEPEEQAEGLDDPRLDLVRQLLEYRKVKEAALKLDDLGSKHARRFRRLFRLRFEDEPQDDEDDAGSLGLEAVGLYDIYNHYDRLMKQTLGHTPVEVVLDDITIEERIDQIVQRLSREPRLSFLALLGEQPSREDIVGLFVALLELTRRRRVQLLQPSDFGDIELRVRADADGIKVSFDAPPDIPSGLPPPRSAAPDPAAADPSADGPAAEEAARKSPGKRHPGVPHYKGSPSDEYAGLSAEEVKLLLRVGDVIERADAASRLFEAGQGGAATSHEAATPQETEALTQIVRAAARDAASGRRKLFRWRARRRQRMFGVALVRINSRAVRRKRGRSTHRWAWGR